MQTIKCKCGADMQITDPIIEVVNQLSVSMIIINHAVMQGMKCRVCSMEYFAAIQGFDMRGVQLAVQPKPAEPQKSAIVTEFPAGFDPRKVF